MSAAVETIRRITNTVARSDRPLGSLQQEVMEYGLLVRGILNRERPEFIEQREIHDPTALSTGIALSPWHAAACMEDRVRTAAFIRGCVLAVDHVLQTRSHRPVHILEAGCGPLGTLILPLLAHFRPEELVVSVVDLHHEAVESVRLLAGHLKFLPGVRESICGDIAQVSLESTADLVLTETMNVALSSEPQVAITRALVRQHPDAVLLPQSIRIDLVLIDWAAESGSFPLQVGDRIVLGTVFELNARTAKELVEDNGWLPAGRIQIPDSVDPRYTLFLTTYLTVFDDVGFGDYDSQITTPVPLQQPGAEPLRLGDTLQFSYRLGDTPGLVWQVVNRATVQ